MTKRALLPLLLLVCSCAPWHLRAESAGCRTFASGGSETIAVDGSYEGHYIVGFGAKDDSSADALSVFAARESPDGGSDVRRTYTHADLPVELPRGTVRGFELSLKGVRSSSDFWLTLAASADGCR